VLAVTDIQWSPHLNGLALQRLVIHLNCLILWCSFWVHNGWARCQDLVIRRVVVILGAIAFPISIWINFRSFYFVDRRLVFGLLHRRSLSSKFISLRPDWIIPPHSWVHHHTISAFHAWVVNTIDDAYSGHYGRTTANYIWRRSPSLLDWLVPSFHDVHNGR